MNNGVFPKMAHNGLGLAEVGMELREEQTAVINQLSFNFSNGIRCQILQLPTGGGKTVAFSGLVHRYLQKFNKAALICVHRDELLKQARKTLYNGFKISAEPIVSGKKLIPTSQVYVAMVETMANRLKARPSWANHIGLLIIDECHRGEFKKLYKYFPNAIIIGCSATPISGKKNDPLKNYFEEIVVGKQIEDLISIGSLCTNETFSIKGLKNVKFRVKGGDYDKTQMGIEFSKNKNVLNTVDAYRKLGEGKKTIIFNCSIEHSKMVNDAFLAAGYNSKHLDGSESPEERKNIFQWFELNDNAILNNVDVATTGFDEPTIRNVIVNRKTKSLTLWLQMTGRGSRPSRGKDYFRIIDMARNALEHGDWRINRNWYQLFHFPELPKNDAGVAPIKSCIQCDAIIPASTMLCPFCGHLHIVEHTYDTIAIEFEMLVGRIDVEKIVTECKEKNHKTWKPFFEILNKTITTLKYKSSEPLTELESMQAYDVFEGKVKEWCRIEGKSFGQSVKSFAKEQFLKKVKEMKIFQTV
jgi:superfamily II DNA or RNA helicase